MSDSSSESIPALRDDLEATLRLILVPGVGPHLRQALLERFGSVEAVLSAAPSELREVPGIGSKLAGKIAGAAAQIDAQEEIVFCQKHGVEILIESDPRYPAVLRETPDPPGALFVRGSLVPRDSLAIGIVGTRHASPYGLRQAERLAGSLARAGLTIISGLARGIDAAAHRGALAAGGRTIGVLGSGVLNVYPPEHAQLAREIAGQGAILSEVPPRAVPHGGMFPQRNRIISGMSLGVLVVEAGDRSGALITARHAMEQGREVFAVPGQVDGRTARGCHRLIRDGARLVESADDILEELGPLFVPTANDQGQIVRHPAELLLNDLEQKVLAAIGTEATLIDEVASGSGLPIAQVLSTLSALEMRRLVRRLSGSTVVRP